MSRKQELQEEIDELRWELANGCYSGYDTTVISKIGRYLLSLQDELDELDEQE